MTLTHARLEVLRKGAKAALRNAYAPYSRFPVGAAVLTEDGKVFTGCNVENASYGLTVCAERSAVFRAVAEGHKKIRAIVIVGGDDSPAPPCGACRQVINEFGPRAVVYSFSRSGRSASWNLKRLLPGAFGPDNLP